MWMQHPNLPDNPPVEVVASAFDEVWMVRGWQPCDPPVEPDPDAAEPPDPPKVRRASVKTASPDEPATSGTSEE